MTAVAAGRRFDMPDGTSFLVVEPHDRTDDGSTVFEVTVPADAFSPPPHRHPEAVDAFEVLEGRLELRVDGEWRSLAAGESFDVPAGAVHTLANRSGATTRVRNVHRPAKRFEDFLEHTDRLMREKGIEKAKDPRVPLLLSMLTLEYPETLVPGRRIDAVVTRVLARIGRIAGLSTTTG